MTASSPNGSVVDVRDLRAELKLRHKAVHAVNGVSISVGPEECLGLVGESGSGKTMLSLAIMRLLPSPFGRITAGEVRFEGRDLLSLPESEMRRLRGDRISMVFQEPMTSLDPLFTVGSQIAEVVRAHTGADDREARLRAVEMLERVQIPAAAQRVDDHPHQLSGGMRQRVMIAMALVLRPALLLADEPTTALDVTVQAQILELIAELQAELKMGVLLITHNLAVVRQVAGRVAVMYAGEIVEVARTDELFTDPRHPYTQGLLRSIPSSARPAERLHVIPGQPPDLTAPAGGCPFAPRCPHALPRCRAEHPDLRPQEKPNHELRCWNPQPFER